MNITNDQSGTDYVTYFTQQLPKDLAAMAVLRDELAKRQGAMTAVEDANKLRTDAENLRKQAQIESDKLLAHAKDCVSQAEARHVALNVREAALAAKAADFDADYARHSAQIDARIKDVQRQEKALQDKESRLILQADELAKEKTKLQSDRAALDARIKTLQDRIASLNV